jgi:hypothetical protein
MGLPQRDSGYHPYGDYVTWPEDVRYELIDGVVQLDVLVVCDQDKLDRRGVRGGPNLVVEVLSPSTARYAAPSGGAAGGVRCVAHRGPDPAHQAPHCRIRGDRLAHEPVMEDLVLVAQQTDEIGAADSIQRRKARLQKPIQQQIQLQHPAAALPAQPRGLRRDFSGGVAA